MATNLSRSTPGSATLNQTQQSNELDLTKKARKVDVLVGIKARDTVSFRPGAMARDTFTAPSAVTTVGARIALHEAPRCNTVFDQVRAGTLAVVPKLNSRGIRRRKAQRDTMCHHSTT